jgi:hypothetical protein
VINSGYQGVVLSFKEGIGQIELTLGREGVKIPLFIGPHDLQRGVNEYQVLEFFEDFWALNTDRIPDEKGLGELSLPPEADKPLTVVRKRQLPGEGPSIFTSGRASVIDAGSELYEVLTPAPTPLIIAGTLVAQTSVKSTTWRGSGAEINDCFHPPFTIFHKGDILAGHYLATMDAELEKTKEMGIDYEALDTDQKREFLRTFFYQGLHGLLTDTVELLSLPDGAGAGQDVKDQS